MDKTPLVMDEIEAGKEFIRRIHAYRPVKAAWWMRETEDAGRYLLVALDGLTVENGDQAYDEVLRITKEMKDHYIDPFDVKLVNPDDPAARAILDHYRRYPGRVPSSFNGSVLGRLSVVEVYVYPPPAP
jgi:hypothetical protein